MWLLAGELFTPLDFSVILHVWLRLTCQEGHRVHSVTAGELLVSKDSEIRALLALLVHVFKSSLGARKQNMFCSLALFCCGMSSECKGFSNFLDIWSLMLRQRGTSLLRSRIWGAEICLYIRELSRGERVHRTGKKQLRTGGRLTLGQQILRAAVPCLGWSGASA